MDELLFTSRQLTEYREWSDGSNGCLFYLIANNDTINESGIYLVDKEKNPQIKKEVLLDPLAHSFLAKENPLDELQYLPYEKWVDGMLSLCRRWLNRDKQVLNDFLSAKRMEEYDDKLRYMLLNEVEKQYNLWALHVKFPTELKGGFIPFFYRLVAAGTILQLCKQARLHRL